MTPLTADMLADRAAAAPDLVADPARWVYRKSAVVSVPEMAREPEVTERWTTADGTAAAAYAGGRLETTSSPEVPAISYAALRELPSDPAALAQRYMITPPGARPTPSPRARHLEPWQALARTEGPARLASRPAAAGQRHGGAGSHHEQLSHHRSRGHDGRGGRVVPYRASSCLMAGGPASGRPAMTAWA